MRCPMCGMELRVKRRTEEGRVLLKCVNPRCDNSKRDENGESRTVAEK